MGRRCPRRRRSTRVRVVDQLSRLLANGVRVLLADISHQDEFQGILVVVLGHPHRQFHLSQLALDVLAQLREDPGLLGGGRIGQTQGVEPLANVPHRQVVSLQVTRVAGQEKAA